MPCTSGAPTTSTGSRSAEAATTLGDRRLDRLEQRVLQQQVVDGVAAQAQLGEHRDRDAVVVARPRLVEDRSRALAAGSAIATGTCTPPPGRTRGRRPRRSPRGESAAPIPSRCAAGQRRQSPALTHPEQPRRADRRVDQPLPLVRRRPGGGGARSTPSIFPNSRIGHLGPATRDAGPDEPGSLTAGEFDLDGLTVPRPSTAARARRLHRGDLVQHRLRRPGRGGPLLGAAARRRRAGPSMCGWAARTGSGSPGRSSADPARTSCSRDPDPSRRIGRAAGDARGCAGSWSPSSEAAADDGSRLGLA